MFLVPSLLFLSGSVRQTKLAIRHLFGARRFVSYLDSLRSNSKMNVIDQSPLTKEENVSKVVV